MPALELTKEESDALTLLLEGHLGDLSYEIADTDGLEFRNQLKSKRDVFAKILKDLKKSAE